MKYLAFVIAALLAAWVMVNSPVLAQIPPESPSDEPSATPGSGNAEQGPGMDQDNPQQSETSPNDPSQTDQGGSGQYGDDQGDPDQMNSDSSEDQPPPEGARPEAEPGVRE